MKGIVDGVEKIVEIVECGSCSCKEYVVVVVSGVLDVVLVLIIHQMVEYMGVYRPIDYSRKVLAITCVECSIFLPM